ncbi:MAG TPA: aldo/keto reductase [Kofleriaceae bacterium]|jgi:diketogulonate reductase-like aldo/keto reductase
MKIRGIDVPDFVYGTAWKESRTTGLVELALAAGFRAIDTANQRKHYFEAAVGDAIANVPRDELFLQTKFTHLAGQDERLPYDPDAPVETQVIQSYESSLEHLHTDRIDSLILHGPSQRVGLHTDDVAAWRAIESLADRVPLIGASNVTAEQVDALVAIARVPPAFVQNRCYASRGWDRDVRAVCARHGIVYQGFSLLTANRDVVQHDRDVRAIAARYGITTAQLVFAFARQLGILALTGTTSRDHMAQDLASLEVRIADDDVAAIAAAGQS